LPRAQVEPSDVGDVGRGGPGPGWPFVVGEAGQACEPLGFEDQGDGDGAEWMPFAVQRAADVVDREVVLAQRDDLVAYGVGRGRGLGALGRRDEEGAVRVASELVDEDAEAARRVAEATGRLDTRETFDEIGPPCLVPPVGGVGRLGEEAREVR
jgi:hypothetical protein